jgi:hypothetical protein
MKTQDVLDVMLYLHYSDCHTVEIEETRFSEKYVHTN